ncbi:NLP5-like [Olea europaea subsp. europaea]|uniref:NLP5-like n=1 Tax=Olea europaea subsp. europaea TaxID=158383 RepID=A0A8S0TX25_OLEEU|nr:NLP5-like [Olea europaea subsp. europaea]
MDEIVRPLNTIFCPPYDAFMEFDYMDELLLGGFWLDGSEFSHYNASTLSGPFDPSLVWPDLEERQRSTFHDSLSINSPSQGPKNTAKSHSVVANAANDGGSLGQSDRYLVESSESSKRWIGQRVSKSVVDRLNWALGYIKDYSRDKDVLIQVWIPVNRGGRRVLTTKDQPFSLDLNCPRLVHYREISVNYHFPVEEASKGVVGLPGRVFLGKVPEWSPDVRFFTRDEYSRVGHAQQYDVRGTFAVPVLERGSSNCLGVIEVILTKEKMKYSAELESVCKALEAVDLRSSGFSSMQNVKTCDLSYQAALPEILEVLRSACETHRLPLAQTWVPCVLQGKGGSRHSDENLLHCVSTVDSACYTVDPSTQDFHEACSEHHLLKGQGIVGRAFMTNQPCFSSDVTAYSKTTEYPLSHHAKMFGLCAAVAIRLRSICTGSADFVLEFFLPKDCRDPEEQKKTLTSLSNVIRKVCCTLRVVTDEELQNEPVSPVCEVANPPVTISSEEIPKVDTMQSLRPSRDIKSWNGKPREILAEISSQFKKDQPDSNSRAGFAFDGIPSTSADDSSPSTSKTGKRRRKKAEKTITLQVLQQYFAGSLKDAAKSIGVCPTTLKRICRHHGIMRWPSRTIKKVGHSLEKIQRVIDKVPGASALQIGSFYSNFPELASPNVSRITQFTNSNPTDCPMPLGRQPENDVFSSTSGTSKSTSTSCSRNSSSSQSYSSETQQNPYTFNISGSMVQEESVNDLLKRSRSEGNLHLSSDVTNFREPSRQESFPRSWIDNGTQSQDGDTQRVKVTYGKEKIRFQMKKRSGYENLLHEIATRFDIDDTSGFHLKYLDDDLEWVLLTCDADLEECINVYRSSQNRTIKLSLLCDSQQHVGSSYGSNSFL